MVAGYPCMAKRKDAFSVLFWGIRAGASVREAEQSHVTILEQIGLTFEPVAAGIAGGG
jgi:hypothetical protein